MSRFFYALILMWKMFVFSLNWWIFILFLHQVVANCLSALQEIWSSEASTSEEASREREGLLSKTNVYYLLNRYVL